MASIITLSPELVKKKIVLTSLMISILLGLVLSFTSLVTIIHESLLSNLRLIQVPGQCF